MISYESTNFFEFARRFRADIVFNTAIVIITVTRTAPPAAMPATAATGKTIEFDAEASDNDGVGVVLEVGLTGGSVLGADVVGTDVGGGGVAAG